jgi:PIN domain nuclease of toxin-antitoxin system
MSAWVLDASALLAYLWQEPGHETVAQRIEQSTVMMSSVNLSEVLSRAADKGMSPSAMAALQAALPFEIIPFDKAQAQTAASLRPPTQALGLSLGDRACLALAIERQAVALTADRVWQELEIEGLAVELLR